MHATKSNYIDHRPVVEFERGVQYYIHMFIYDIHVYNDTYERVRKPYINMAIFNNIKRSMSKI